MTTYFFQGIAFENVIFKIVTHNVLKIQHMCMIEMQSTHEYGNYKEWQVFTVVVIDKTNFPFTNHTFGLFPFGKLFNLAY